MSWDFYKNSTPKARKEYDCDWKDHLELSDMITCKHGETPASVNHEQCKEYGLTDEEIKVLEQYLSDGCKIKKGEVHNVTEGKIEGMFAIFRGKTAISDIIHKYDLNEE